jgi:membrane fusion protein (multidrug efflux system)
MVSAGSDLLTLDDLSVMELDLQVPERYLSLLTKGMKVKSSNRAWPDTAFVGELTAIDSRVNTDTLNLRVRAKFDNKDNHLKPGMMMSAEIVFPAIRSLIVPVQALEYSDTKRFVYRIGDDNKVVRTEVILGGRIDDSVMIESGVEVGERIVLQGLVNMSDGVKIKDLSQPDTGKDKKRAKVKTIEEAQ